MRESVTEERPEAGQSPNEASPAAIATTTTATEVSTGIAPAEAGREGGKSVLREIVETVVFALLVFVLVQSIWRNFWVDGPSMEPNIHSGQYLIVNRLVYRTGFPVAALRRTIGANASGKRLLDYFFHPPRRGDVIVFVPPNNRSRDYIKRVIGIPGDRVEIKQGRVYINSYALIEPYAAPSGGGSWGPAVVGANQLFVLGDNRPNSSDSRSFGMLAQSDVIGQAFFSYWPPRTWGLMPHYDLSVQLQNR